ncbi:putative cytosolic oligopeptidase A [Trifolium repens]|nr:putative cytosolic oligopeptidase A [Trifolium repens]
MGFNTSRHLTSKVETVFHEFGHTLQHMLTKEDEGLVVGNWGDSPPEDVYLKIVAARTYRAGSQSLRKVVIIGHVFNVQPISDSKNLKQVCDLYGRKCSRNTLQVQC